MDQFLKQNNHRPIKKKNKQLTYFRRYKQGNIKKGLLKEKKINYKFIQSTKVNFINC